MARRGFDSGETVLSRRSLLRGAAATAGVAAGGVLLNACGGSEPSAQSTAGSSGGTDQVTFLAILPMTSMTFTPEYIAQAAGFFEEQNLKVNFETTRGSAPAIQTILADKALITRVGDNETMVAAGERGAPALNVGTIQRKAPMRLASSTQHPLRKPEDLRGTKIGLPSAGGTSEVTLDLVLSQAGIPKDSVSRQVVGGFSASSFSLVQSGRLDGYVVSLDIFSELQQQRDDVAVLDPSEFITAGSQIYMTSKSSAESNPDVLRRYLKATRAAVEFVVDDREKDFDETLQHLESSSWDLSAMENKDVARESLRYYVESWLLEGRENLLKTVPQKWKAAYQEMVQAGMVPDGENPQEWFTNEYWPQSA